MNLKEHLLVCLAEEASEVAQEAVKAVFHGINTPSAGSGGETTYGDLIALEYADMEAILGLLNLYDIHLTPASRSDAEAYFKVKLTYVSSSEDVNTLLLRFINALNALSQAVAKCLRFSTEYVAPFEGVTHTNLEVVALCLTQVDSILDMISLRTGTPLGFGCTSRIERRAIKTSKTLELAYRYGVPLGALTL